MTTAETGATWDAFISHASEDKDGFVRPLAEALVSLGASIWYDEFTLRLGDSLSESIDRGLAQSRFGVVVISPDFMNKAWTRHELRGLWTREISGRGDILPVWHNVQKDAVEAFSPTLADRVAVSTAGRSAADIALAILAEIRPDLHAAHPRAELLRRADGSALAELQEEVGSLRGQLSEFQCPYCGSTLVSSIDAPIDEEEKHWDVRKIFECRYREFAGEAEALCPADPRFPALDDYELITAERGTGPARWHCEARSKTANARKVDLRPTFGVSRQAATDEMELVYEQHAKPWLRPFGETP
jgi:hypothetical protein